MSEIYERIKLIRKEKGLTQTEFGAIIGLSRDAIAQIEIGRSTIKEVAIRSILLSFPDVSEDWLRYGSGSIDSQKRTSEQEVTDLMKLVADFPDDAPQRRMILYLAEVIADMNTRQINQFTNFVKGLSSVLGGEDK